MNEHDVVLFHNYNIVLVEADLHSDTHSEVSEDDTYDATEPVEVDIFSDDHPWDNRVNSYRFRPDLWFSEQELTFFLSN